MPMMVSGFAVGIAGRICIMFRAGDIPKILVQIWGAIPLTDLRYCGIVIKQNASRDRVSLANRDWDNSRITSHRNRLFLASFR